MNDPLRNEIARLIDAFVAGELDDRAGNREIVKQTDVLPAFEDWSAFGGITPEGTAVWVNRDPPHEIEVIERARLQRHILYAASQRYPTLAALRPQRPPEAVVCHYCRGTGEFQFDIPDHVTEIEIGGQRKDADELRQGFVCYCGGLGWLLEGA